MHQQVRRLEEELGVVLFERVGKDRVALTAAGRALYAFVGPFLERFPAVVSSLQDGTMGGVLRVQAATLVLRWLLPSWLQRLQAAHPALVVDAEGAVLVAGRVRGTLPGQTSSGNDDAFVRKYDNDGTVVWTRQFGLELSGNEVALSVSVDATGNAFVVGEAISQFAPVQAFIRKYDGAGMPGRTPSS